MKRIAIAGGIGAGKSAVTDRLGQFGYSVIDADEVAREVTSQGSAVWKALRDAFGEAVVDREGNLDRAFVAEIVFHDPSSLRRINQITHGPIGEAILHQLEEMEGDVIFIALPLFRPEHRALLGLDEVWAILADPEIAVHRLIRHRDFSELDARARVAIQMTNAEREKIVDRVIWNDGTLEELFDRIDEAMMALRTVNG